MALKNLGAFVTDRYNKYSTFGGLVLILLFMRKQLYLVVAGRCLKKSHITVGHSFCQRHTYRSFSCLRFHTKKQSKGDKYIFDSLIDSEDALQALNSTSTRICVKREEITPSLRFIPPPHTKQSIRNQLCINSFTRKQNTAIQSHALGHDC